VRHPVFLAHGFAHVDHCKPARRSHFLRLLRNWPPNRSGRPGSLQGGRLKPKAGLSLDFVIHLELNRVRMVFDAGHFFHLQINVGVDLIIIHDAALLEEVAVGVE
jgi:hypothetical protein